jgi:hypothetical protein
MITNVATSEFPEAAWLPLPLLTQSKRLPDWWRRASLSKLLHFPCRAATMQYLASFQLRQGYEKTGLLSHLLFRRNEYIGGPEKDVA